MRHSSANSRRTKTVALLVAATAIAACAGGNATLESPFTEQGAERAVLRVDNHSFMDARVYLIWNGTMRVPLGAVESMDSRTWELPPPRIAEGSGLRNGSFRLEARFSPSRDVSTSPLRLLSDGRQWIWQLENDMSFASLVIR